MSPYFGILIDSFWEAVGNKVLWALLIGWSILLVCLAPFGYVSERSFQLSSADIDNRSQLLEKLGKAAKGQGTEAAKAVVANLDPKFVDSLKQAAGSDSRRDMRPSKLAEELNVAVKGESLYSEEAFPTAQRRKRLEPLLEAPEELGQAAREELNRELLQLAFPLELNRPRGEQLWIGYAGFKLGSPLAISRRQVREYVEPIALQVIIKLGLGILAVFVAIIVTSPIIPDTFRSGSLHLLLSKPISRVWLYLSKFFGGTIFVLVNITFVLVGLYLIAGLRFEIWNSGLLLCIPLLLFVFTIFYSVSGLAGLLWGNAIVCVVSCMIFWFCCFCLGFAKGSMQPHAELFPRINKIREIKDYLTTVTENGRFNIWNTQHDVWQPAIEHSNRGNQALTFGPIYDAENEQILVKSFIRNPFGSPFARDRKISVISLSSESTMGDSSGPNDASNTPETQVDSDASLVSTSESPDSVSAANVEEVSASEGSDRADDAEEVIPDPGSGSVPADEKPKPPAGEEERTETTTATVQSSPKSRSEPAEVQALSSESESDLESIDSAKDARQTPRWDYDSGPEIPAQLFDLLELNEDVIAICRGGLYRLNLEQVKLLEASEKSLLGFFKLPAWASKSAFQNIAPPDYFLSENSSAAGTADGQGLIVFSSGNLDHFRLTEDGLELSGNAKLDGDADNTEPALVQMNEAYCVVARDGLPLSLLDGDLESVAQIELPQDAKVKQMSWVPTTNMLAIVTHQGSVLKLDCDDQVISEFQFPLSDITCLQWIDAEHVWVATQPDFVYQVDLGEQEILQSFVPAPSTFETIYRWGVNPLYRILPKPAALDDAMLYLLTGSETQSMNLITNDLEAAQLELDIWTPILSNMAFVLVVLAISCIYIARKEF